MTLNLKSTAMQWVARILVIAVVLGAIYFVAQWVVTGGKWLVGAKERSNDEYAVQRVLERNLIPTPTPLIEVKEVPVVDPELKQKVDSLEKEVKSLR